MRKKWIQRACMAGYYSKVGGGGLSLMAAERARSSNNLISRIYSDVKKREVKGNRESVKLKAMDTKEMRETVKF